MNCFEMHDGEITHWVAAHTIEEALYTLFAAMTDMGYDDETTPHESDVKSIILSPDAMRKLKWHDDDTGETGKFFDKEWSPPPEKPEYLGSTEY